MCARLAYLNAGTLGPLPRRSGEAVAAWTRRLVEEGRSSKALFEELLALRERVRAEIAALLNAPEGSIALTTATTDGCNIVLTGLGIGPADEVVTTDSEHPGLFGGLLASGATVRIAAIRERPTGEALALVEGQITDQTRLIALSHVSWLTGAVLPIKELAERHDIPLLVDGAQGVGAIPVDVRDGRYRAVAKARGLTRDDLTTLARNSFLGSFLPREEVAGHVETLEAYVAAA